MSSSQVILFGNDDFRVKDELVTNDELMGKPEKTGAGTVGCV